MNTKEIGDLLGLMALVDKRSTGVGDIMAWEEYLPPDMSFDDAREALRAIRTRSSEWVTPAHIINEVRGLQRARLQRAGDPPLPGYLTWQQEREWRQLWCDRVKDGMDKDMAAESASRVMNLHPEIPAAERRAALAELISTSKRVPPGHPATNRTEP